MNTISELIVPVFQGKTQNELIRALIRNVSQYLKDNEVLWKLLIQLSQHDQTTYLHSLWVTFLSVHMARSMNYREADLEDLALGALFHDIGKLSIPTNILNKPGHLSDDEFEIIKTHPLESERILKTTGVNLPSIVYEIVRQHHERWKGQGYPHSFSEEKINEKAQIVAIADVFEALTANRPYRPAMPHSRAVDIILKGKEVDYSRKLIHTFERTFC